MSTELTQRTSVPVTVGGLTLWCSSVRAEGRAVWSETPSVSGEALVTNRLRRLTKVILTGRVYSGSGSLLIAAELDGLITAGSVSDTEIEGITLTGCRVGSYTAEDSGGAFIDVTLALLAESIEVTEGGQE